MSEGEEEEQKIENLFEKIMKDYFPNLAKEIDLQELETYRSTGSSESPKKCGPKEAHIKTHHSYISQD